LAADGASRLSDVSSVQKVVIGIAKLAVSDLQLAQEVLQHLTVDLRMN